MVRITPNAPRITASTSDTESPKFFSALGVKKEYKISVQKLTILALVALESARMQKGFVELTVKKDV